MVDFTPNGMIPAIYIGRFRVSKRSSAVTPVISILEIIFLHYAARSFCETIKFKSGEPFK